MGYKLLVTSYNHSVKRLKPATFFIFCLVFFSLVSFGQSSVKKDTTIILISDVTVQLETTDAMNSLYNFKFAEAEKLFRSFKEKYRWHPLPYFLMGLAEWWKIMPNTRVTTYDEKFLSYMDSSILIAENLYENYPEYKIEAAFFLAAAHGFKGELHADVERKNWMKADMRSETSAASQVRALLGKTMKCRK